MLKSNLFNEGIFLIDFYADWCAPCKTMSPIIDELSKKFEDKIKIVKINIEYNEEMVNEFNVVSLPNFVFLDNGKLVEQFAGSISSDKLEKKIEKHL